MEARSRQSPSPASLKAKLYGKSPSQLARKQGRAAAAAARSPGSPSSLPSASPSPAPSTPARSPHPGISAAALPSSMQSPLRSSLSPAALRSPSIDLRAAGKRKNVVSPMVHPTLTPIKQAASPARSPASSSALTPLRGAASPGSGGAAKEELSLTPQTWVNEERIRRGGPPLTEEQIRDPATFIAYLKHNPDSIEFVYCRQIEPSVLGIDSIYDIEVVPFAMCNQKNYYTLSALGLTRFIRGDSQYTPLDEYLEERAIFVKMVRVPFFRLFHRRKVFWQWKSLVKSGKRRKTELYLERTAFVLNPVLGPALLAARKHCLDVATTVVGKFDENTYDLVEFLEMSHERREEHLAMLLDRYQELAAMSLKACQSVVSEQRLFMLLNAAGPEAEQEMRSARRLRNFVRVTDMLLVSAMMDVVETSTAYFLDFLQSSPPAAWVCSRSWSASSSQASSPRPSRAGSAAPPRSCRCATSRARTRRRRSRPTTTSCARSRALRAR